MTTSKTKLGLCATRSCRRERKATSLYCEGCWYALLQRAFGA